MERLLHNTTLTRHSVLAVPLTLSHLISLCFLLSTHSTESTPSNKNALLAQTKHWMPEGLKLLSPCCGDSGESQKQTEEPWLQLLPRLHLLCLQTEHLFIFTGLSTNGTADEPQFSHVSINLTGAVTWHHNTCLSLTSVRYFTEIVLLLCHFPVLFLAWHTLKHLLRPKTSWKKPEQTYFVDLAGLETSRTLAMVSHYCTCHCYEEQSNFGLHPLPRISWELGLQIPILFPCKATTFQSKVK